MKAIQFMYMGYVYTYIYGGTGLSLYTYARYVYY